MSDDKLIKAIEQQKQYYLVQTIIVSSVIFSVWIFFKDSIMTKYFYNIANIILTWSCGITALAYAKKYLRKDLKYRKVANEVIYPFYLLQQPVIVILGYFTAQWDIPILLKVLIFTTLSFSITIGIYWFFIKPFNILRIIFGLKPLKRE